MCVLVCITTERLRPKEGNSSPHGELGHRLGELRPSAGLAARQERDGQVVGVRAPLMWSCPLLPPRVLAGRCSRL